MKYYSECAEVQQSNDNVSTNKVFQVRQLTMTKCRIW